VEKSDKWSVIHSSDRMDWATPLGLFKKLDGEFHFTLDAAASDSNHKCDRYFTKEDDALSKPLGEWAKQSDGGAIWLNPPYGKEVGRWVRRAYKEACFGSTVVVLVSACTDTLWWAKAWPRMTEVRFITGRVKFLHPDTGEPVAGAPKGSAILVFKPAHAGFNVYRRFPQCSLMVT